MKTIARAFVPLLLIVVGGCASPTIGELSPEDREAMTPVHYVAAARLDLNRLLRTVNSYAQQPRCTEVVVVGCSDDVVVQTALTYLKEADSALDEAEIIVRSGGDTPEELIGSARGALARVSAYLVAKEVATP